MTDIVADGGCLCGAVRFSIKGSLLWSGHCHCESCRRQTSSPMTTYFCVRESDMMFHGESLEIYESSEGVERSFCKICGTPMSYTNQSRPGEIDLYVASLDFPEKLSPEKHMCWEERLPWLSISDDLPKSTGDGPDDT
ncbi:MAG: GFA family protein [Pseudomonadota bacterium]